MLVVAVAPAVAVAPVVAVAGLGGTLAAAGTGGVLAVSWAMLSEYVPEGGCSGILRRGECSDGDGRRALGPLWAGGRSGHMLLPLDAYAVAFALAALVAFSRPLPLHHVIHAAASTTHPSGRNASL